MSVCVRSHLVVGMCGLEDVVQFEVGGQVVEAAQGAGLADGGGGGAFRQPPPRHLAGLLGAHGRGAGLQRLLLLALPPDGAEGRGVGQGGEGGLRTHTQTLS